MSSSSLAIEPTLTRAAVGSRLIVTRRDPHTRRYRALAFLDQCDDGSFEFAYLAAAVADPTFVPIVGFSDPTIRYRRPVLFPAFAERVISAKRPDRPSYLASLQLADDAGAWEILAASGGYREGDAIELISMPTHDPATGHTHARFLAHAVRYLDTEASEHLSQLRPGQVLHIEPEPTNIANSRALKIVDGPYHLGYIPDPLVDYVAAVLGQRDATLTVVKANSAQTHPHLRLLLQMRGTLADGNPFEGWRTTA